MMKAQRKRTKLATSIIAVFSAVMILLSGCENKTDEEVYQSFGIDIKSNESDINLKSWNPTDWSYSYYQFPVTFTLTGVTNGKTYAKECSVQELKDGTVSFQMLPGDYTVSYTTPHWQSDNIWSMNNVEGLSTATRRNQLNEAGRSVGDVLDIKISNTINVSGSPITLNATLDDALIVVDVPNVQEVKVFLSNFSEVNPPRLLNNITGIHYGYVNSGRLLQLKFYDGTTQNITPATGTVKGKVYHIISRIGASVELNIPNMEVISVEL